MGETARRPARVKFPCQNPSCGYLIYADEAVALLGKGTQGFGVKFVCRECQTQHNMLIDPRAYALLLMDRADLGLGDLPRADQGSPPPAVSDQETIGRTVHGFRIDMDTVHTVEDLQLYWRYQEAVDPFSVVREQRGPLHRHG